MSKKKTISRRLRAGSFTAFALASSAAWADHSPALDPVSIWIGGYYANAEASLGAKTPVGNVSTGALDLQDGDETVGRARLDLLFFDTQGFTFDYYTLSHSSTDTLTQPFNFGGVPFELNSTLKGKLDFSAGSASWHWWLDAGDDVFGIGLGATYYRAKLDIAGTIALNGETSAASVHSDEDAVAPLLTLAYKHAFSDSFRFYIDASGVRKSGGNLTGHIYDARAGLEWFPWHNVGVGAEYGDTRIRLDRESQNYDAKLDLKLHGPSLFARFRF